MNNGFRGGKIPPKMEELLRNSHYGKIPPKEEDLLTTKEPLIQVAKELAEKEWSK